ncbi:hypothetical protein LX81_03202 [Palleronia aestuarii]|uniref:Uncharacterized protein n=1 Tax=Palleronia aestuarii TaxID=568105 RepID=A0A2W7N0Z9_9RHOB|nr:hypothetical protein [Palleronia aestuarii]PZX13651.1 hypothetical protein LX81_03202 [Palleronia aestuarii]
MKPIMILALPAVLLFGGCVSEGTSTGIGANSSGGTTSGTIRLRDDGAYALGVSTTNGYCSAVYRAPRPNGSELRPLACTTGAGGNATVRYGSDGTPVSATYGGLEIGSGTITF